MANHHASKGCGVGARAGQHALLAQGGFQPVENKIDGQIIAAAAP